jgi:hypothetical protein
MHRAKPESNFWTSPIFVIVPSSSKEFDEARRVVGLPTRRAPSLAAPPTKARALRVARVAASDMSAARRIRFNNLAARRRVAADFCRSKACSEKV